MQNNIMIAKYLWVAGSSLIALFGCIHLYYTFFTNKFSSRNQKVIEEMKTSSPILTTETTIWKAWIGFNASHGTGIIFLGILNVYLATEYFEVFQSDHFFFVFNILIAGFYVWLARKYWFKSPLVGVSITLACFIGSYFMVLTNR